MNVIGYSPFSEPGLWGEQAALSRSTQVDLTRLTGSSSMHKQISLYTDEGDRVTLSMSSESYAMLETLNGQIEQNKLVAGPQGAVDGDQDGQSHRRKPR